MAFFRRSPDGCLPTFFCPPCSNSNVSPPIAKTLVLSNFQLSKFWSWKCSNCFFGSCMAECLHCPGGRPSVTCQKGSKGHKGRFIIVWKCSDCNQQLLIPQPSTPPYSLDHCHFLHTASSHPRNARLLTTHCHHNDFRNVEHNFFILFSHVPSQHWIRMNLERPSCLTPRLTGNYRVWTIQPDHDTM